MNNRQAAETGRPALRAARPREPPRTGGTRVDAAATARPCGPTRDALPQVTEQPPNFPGQPDGPARSGHAAFAGTTRLAGLPGRSGRLEERRVDHQRIGVVSAGLLDRFLGAIALLRDCGSLNLWNAREDESCTDSYRFTGRLSVPERVRPRAPWLVRNLFFATHYDRRVSAIVCGWPTARRDGGRWLSRTAMQPTSRHPNSPFPPRGSEAPAKMLTISRRSIRPFHRGRSTVRGVSATLQPPVGSVQRLRHFALHRLSLGCRPHQRPSVIGDHTVCDVRCGPASARSETPDASPAARRKASRPPSVVGMHG